MPELSLLERARNMIAALQWAGRIETGYCETCSDISECCPLCEALQYHYEQKGHKEGCALAGLLQDLNTGLVERPGPSRANLSVADG